MAAVIRRLAQTLRRSSNALRDAYLLARERRERRAREPAKVRPGEAIRDAALLDLRYGVSPIEPPISLDGYLG